MAMAEDPDDYAFSLYTVLCLATNPDGIPEEELERAWFGVYREQLMALPDRPPFSGTIGRAAGEWWYEWHQEMPPRGHPDFVEHNHHEIVRLAEMGELRDWELEQIRRRGRTARRWLETTKHVAGDSVAERKQSVRLADDVEAALAGFITARPMKFRPR
jgi:hypothetical protein